MTKANQTFASFNNFNEVVFTCSWDYKVEVVRHVALSDDYTLCLKTEKKNTNKTNE